MQNLLPKHIEQLENEKNLSFIGDHNKVEIALTLLGLKPSFFMDWQEPLTKKDQIHNESHELEQLLIENNCNVRSFFTTENQSVWCRFYCARNEEILEKLIHTEYTEGDSKEVIKNKDKERGLLLGYQKTAVEAYVNNQNIHDNELPIEVKKSPIFKLIGHRLSRDNWNTELEEFKRHTDIVKSVFPNLYNRIINEHIPNEQDIAWNEIRRQVDTITDRLGMPVDEEIKEVVVGLRANGINTVSSCGGHTDGDRLAFPWVCCAASDQPEFRFKDEENIKNAIAQKYSILATDIFNVENDSAQKDYYEMTRNAPETDEYIEWDKRNLPLKNKVGQYIKEYYAQRVGGPVVRIALGDIYPGCLINIPDEDERKWRETLSQDELKSKIREAQKEMERFGDFLKLSF